MSIVQSGAQHRLRYNHGGGADGSRQLRGVIIEQRIPGDSWVKFTFDQPSELPQSDDIKLGGVATNSRVKFVVEACPRPTVNAVAGGVSIRNRQRVLNVGGSLPNGQMVPVQVEGAWAAQTLAPVVPSAGLALKGRYAGMIESWPRDPASGPAFTGVQGSGQVPVGQLLRVRWLGTAQTSTTIFTPSGSVKVFAGSLHATRLDYAPGSIVLTATVGAAPMTIRDTGSGRLVGQQATTNVIADGTINYRTGEYTLTFSANPDAAAVTGVYEYSTLYLPLDIDLSWDAEAQ